MFKTASIFILLFLFSCTVTKRVHRPGYHIEWKKNYRVQKSDLPENTKEISKNESNSAVVNAERRAYAQEVEELDVVDSENYSETDKIQLSEERSHKRQESTGVKQQARHVSRSMFRKVKSRSYFPIKIPSVQKQKKASNEFVSEGFRAVGFVLLGLGGFLLMGSMISYFGFWVLEELFYSLVFSGNGFIAGLLGFILFLIILVVVFVAYAIVRYIFGGSYVGFIVSFVCIGAGLLSLLIAVSL